MRTLDILSPSPNLYLFQKESNKTNFGGFLFLIYLIIMILLFIYYLLDYIRNPKYTIQSFIHFNFKTDREIEERQKNETFNPNIWFKLKLKLYNEVNEEYVDITNNFTILNFLTGELKDINSAFNSNISDFNYAIFYKCEYSNCSDYIDYLDMLKQRGMNTTYLYLSYQGFVLDHQDPSGPIKKKGTFTYRVYINLNQFSYINFDWKNILYTEKKMMFFKDYKNSCGFIEGYNSLIIHENSNDEIGGKTYAGICAIKFLIDSIQYIEYSRIRISELDIIANVLSLMANIYTGASLILRFYINNFNNFKIIEKILNKKPTKKIKEPLLEMNYLENNKTISLKEDFSENDLKKENNNITDNNNMDKNNESEENDDNVLSTNSKKINKLHFFDFFMNNCYFCYKKRKEQKIIHLCNEIVYKYSSIDNLIKNQIMVENLFKDYKWNDPTLNNVENNDLVIQLKTYL